MAHSGQHRQRVSAQVLTFGDDKKSSVGACYRPEFSQVPPVCQTASSCHVMVNLQVNLEFSDDLKSESIGNSLDQARVSLGQ
jgi:hypothetical protein